MLTTWKEWRTRFPGTQVMKPMPGYLDRFDVLRSRWARSRSGEGAAPDGSFNKDDRLRPRERVAGLAVGNETMAFQIAALTVARVVNERIGGVPIVVIHQPASETTTAYEARVKDRVLRFDAANAGATLATDRETHSTWDAYGLATKGPLKGTQLKQLILIPEFWFAWSQFRPSRSGVIGEAEGTARPQREKGLDPLRIRQGCAARCITARSATTIAGAYRTRPVRGKG